MLFSIQPETAARLTTAAADAADGTLRCARAFSHRLQRVRKVLKGYNRLTAGYTQLTAPDREFLDLWPRLDQAAGRLARELCHAFLPIRREKRADIPCLVSFLILAIRDEKFDFSEGAAAFLAERFSSVRPMKNAELELFPELLQTAALFVIASAAEKRKLEDEASLWGRAAAAFHAANGVDKEELVSRFSSIERAYTADPIYKKQDAATRAIYRGMTADIARARTTSEKLLAQELAAKAQKEQKHIGILLFPLFREEFPPSLFAQDYPRILLTVPAILSLLLSGVLHNPLWSLLLYLPMLALWKPILEQLALRGRGRESYLPRLELDGSIPEEGRTLLVLSSLLPKEGDLPALRERLLELYPTRADGALGLCLLCDLPEAKERSLPGDQAKLDGVKKLCRELNAAYGGRLLLLARERTFCQTQQAYNGEERKRGAILALLRMKKGKRQAWAAREGDVTLLSRAKYLLALDYDTGLPPGGAAELVSIALHPLNRPVLDPQKRRIVGGHGILSPRLTVRLSDTVRTPFARIMGGEGGASSYDGRSPELWQTIAGKSIFCGKGLLDIDACLSCLDEQFAPETVLSHDILEGGLLRAGFAGDVILSEGFPEHAEGFFRRMERWVRGDFQNAPFLCSRLKLYRGEGENPLSPATRFQLLENLLRALIPVAGLLCLFGAGILTGAGKGILLLSALAAADADAAISAIRLLFGRISHPSPRLYFAFFRRMGENLSRLLLRFVLMPQFAVTALCAAGKGLWRRLVSHKKMLEWTPMAQTARKKGSAAFLFFFFPQFFFALLVLLLLPALWWVGAAFAAALPLLRLLSRERQEGQTFSTVEADSLLGDLRRMLQWFDDYAGAEDNYLPPDNVQLSPRFAVAHRTSPTNIGMLLLAYLAGYECSAVTAIRLAEVCGRAMDALEQMETFHGNLYNWYDTRTLEVLSPRFVSSVDSGNLLCCLTAVKEGLRACFTAHPETGAAPIVAARIEDFLNGAELSVFYDKKRGLFSVGWDSVQNALAPYHYDMLMSEARMLSYFAVCRGEVPARHWQSLSRALSRTGLSVGPLSWTGTMFEYFMPELLLHCIRESLGFAGLRHCVRCQKKRGKEEGVPWGISESGIFAFDEELCYRYQPNGVQSLALKAGMDRELVVAPYASYLALSFAGKEASGNLVRLRAMDCYGKYGFFEAVDFTPSRVGEHRFEGVQSHMAHHLGMSICAICNALKNNPLKRYFLADFFMRRGQLLLQEKSTGGEVMTPGLFERKRRRLADIPEEWEFCGQPHPAMPKVKLLANGELCGVYTDSGSCWLQTDGIDLTRRPDDLLRSPVGSYCFLQTEDERFSLTSAPGYGKGAVYEAAFSSSGVRYTAKRGELTAQTEIRLHRRLSCEQRRVTVKNNGKTPLTVTLLFYLEPSLFPRADDDSHKAFSKLFLRVDRDEERRVAIVSRKRRDDGKSFFLAAGLREEEFPFDLLHNRNDVFSRPDTALPKKSAFSSENGKPDHLGEPCVCLRVKLTLGKNEEKALTLLTCTGSSRTEAVGTLTALRREEPIGRETSASDRMEGDSLPGRVAKMLLPQILFDKRDSARQQNAIRQNLLSRAGLWLLGISGDLPVVLCEVASATDITRIRAYARCHGFLKLSFIPYDLVFLYDGAPETKEAIRETVSLSVGEKGGIHIVNLAELEDERKTLLFAYASHIAPRSMVRIEMPVRPFVPLKLLPVSPILPEEKLDLSVSGGGFLRESFFVTHPPERPWCHILANPTFGTMVSDQALGFTWAINSRELKLTPWHNDPLRDNRGEMLLLRTKDGCFDLLLGSTAEFCPDYARWRGRVGELESCVTVRIPAKGMKKTITLELTNHSASTITVDAAYYTEPCLSVARFDAGRITGELTGGAMLLHNPFCAASAAWMAMDVSGKEFSFACDRADFLCGHWRQDSPPPSPGMCAALSIHHQIPPGRVAALRFQLSFGATREGALSLLSLRPEETLPEENNLRVEGGEPAVALFVNTWLPWQIRSARLFGRTGFYQNSGGYGFRDQLQDVCGYMPLSPLLARRQIFRCCAVQFREGDVLHWWHSLPASGGGRRGVRTRYSDDLVFLPYAAARYYRMTGDRKVFEVSIRFLEAEELSPEEHDRYLTAKASDEIESVYEHCRRALARAYRLGEHDLPLMGGGDWNDGYNLVGAGGEGESVWLAQFLALTMKEFAPVCREMEDEAAARECEERAAGLLAAVDRHGWDGEWYLRAFYDDGTSMGGSKNDSCRIDSLPQSFAVLSGMENLSRLEQALSSAWERLADRQNNLIRLFAPAFDEDSSQRPGYVSAYPAGVRENGGQYTHAAVWLALAMGRLGEKERFWALTRMLNPIHRCMAESEKKRYGLEPYALAGDIYANPQAYGQGGWSLYTGASGWYFTLLTEQYLGLAFSPNGVTASPCLPPGSPPATVRGRWLGKPFSFRLSPNGDAE